MNQTILPKRNIQTLFQLFIRCFYISAFTFGGGYVMITFMKQKFVDELHWIDNDEMLDLAAIAQSSPGVIAVNVAIMVGLKVSGFLGMIVAIFGTILPPMIIISIISFFYHSFRTNHYISLLLNGMQAGVAAVICNVVIQLGLDIKKQNSKLDLLIMLFAFMATYLFHLNVILIILCAVLIGIIRSYLNKNRRHP